MALRSLLPALGLLACAACASDRQPVQLEEVSAPATFIRLASPEFTEAESVHLARTPADDGRFFVSRFVRDDTMAQIHYQIAPGGYGFGQAYGAGGQAELRRFLPDVGGGEPTRQDSGSVVTRVANFRYHLFEASAPRKPHFWCSSFDGLVGTTLGDRPSARGRIWGFYCRRGYPLSDDDVEELLQSLTVRA